MSAPLLATKLFIPPAGKSLVVRPRLLEKLNVGLQPGCRLTLVSAPAGFGKTTLVSTWVTSLKLSAYQPSPIVAWLSLDDKDNDPVIFWSYLIASLQTQRVELGEQALSLLQTAPSSDLEAILVLLVNELVQIPNPFILILDDLHLVRNPEIHRSLSFVIDHVPSQFHVMVLSRTDPPLPLALLRGRGQLLEIRLSDLRFSSEEAQAYLNEGMKLALPSPAVNTLNDKTEGWIAGLQMAALSLQGNQDNTRFVQSFSGSNRYVLEYLVEEVLNRQPQDVKEFLLSTSILDRLCGPLCDAVLDSAYHSQSLLEFLEHANLFLIPLDEEQHWYRYHQLFSDLLRKRREQEDAVGGKKLHGRASQWFEQNGLIYQAVEHAFLAEDYPRVARLLDESVDNLWKRGEHTWLFNWTQKLPEGQLQDHLTLYLFKAAFLATNSSLHEAEECLGEIEQLLPAAAIESSQRYRFAGQVSALHALIANFRGNPTTTRQYATQALRTLSKEQDPFWWIMLLNTLGGLELELKNFPACRQYLIQAIEVGKKAGYSMMILNTITKLVYAMGLTGRLKEAGEICSEGLQLISQYHLEGVPTTSLILLAWGNILFERYELDEAEKFIVRGLELSRSGNIITLQALGCFELTMLWMTQGDLQSAEEVLQEADRLAREHELPFWLESAIGGLKALLWIRLGRITEAENYLDGRDVRLDAKVEFPHHVEYQALVYLLLHKGELTTAANLLEHLVGWTQADHQEGWVLTFQSLLSVVYQTSGDFEKALRMLESALELAEPQGYVRIFVEKDEVMAVLLKKAVERRIYPDYARRLLEKMRVSLPSDATTPGLQKPQFASMEPLTEREKEVLGLIAEGCTNKEIAKRLYISLRTVKYHATSIYIKLGVNRRAQAAVKAGELGLL